MSLNRCSVYFHSVLHGSRRGKEITVPSDCRDVISSEAADSERRPLARGIASSCSFSRMTMDWKPVDRAHLSTHVHTLAFLSPSSSFLIKSLSTEFIHSWSIWCQVSSVRSIIIIVNHQSNNSFQTYRLSSCHYPFFCTVYLDLPTQCGKNVFC